MTNRKEKTMNQNTTHTQSLPTFEDLQQHMDSFDVDALGNQQTLLPRSLAETIEHLASIYAMVQPVLTVVGALPLFPSRWLRGVALLRGAIEAVLVLAGDPSFKAGRDLEEFKAGRDLEE
jgi:hypothetical protein